MNYAIHSTQVRKYLFNFIRLYLILSNVKLNLIDVNTDFLKYLHSNQSLCQPISLELSYHFKLKNDS